MCSSHVLFLVCHFCAYSLSEAALTQGRELALLYSNVPLKAYVLTCSVTMIERNPTPWGGFLFTMFPNQEPGRRGAPSKNLFQVLRGGSISFRFLIREHSK